MRRKEQEIVDKAELEALLTKAKVLRLGLIDGNAPYVVPVCFGYRDGRLYVHSSAQGRKMEIIKRNNLVCFEVEEDVEVVSAAQACKWTVRYRSVIGYGRVSLVEDSGEKIEALNIIMDHYSGKPDQEYPEPLVDLTAILRIDIESMTGKRSKETVGS